MQLTRLFRQTVARLRQAGIEEPESDVYQLFSYCFGLSRSEFIMQGDREAEPAMASCLEKMVARRLTREPLQHITGHREFWSLDFHVSPAVLIPRPETEFLVDRVVAQARTGDMPAGPFVDMCTGSGVIAVVLARELGRPVVAVDSSVPALEVAAANIARHRQKGGVSLLGSDLFSAFRQGPCFACCVANPPYITEEEFPHLQPEVRDWEPRSALLAGRQGLDIIRRLAADAPSYLQPGGWLFMEIGAGQGEAVQALFSAAPQAYEEPVVHPDWSGRARVLQARIKDMPHE
jgi:release factor glutamine methyltransferase